MKIQGSKCATFMEAKYRQPYPVVASPVVIDGKPADFVISLGEYRYEIDGEMFSGEMLLCLGREVPK
jgi:hypothetical protein